MIVVGLTLFDEGPLPRQACIRLGRFLGRAAIFLVIFRQGEFSLTGTSLACFRGGALLGRALA